jgi:hypothetical protein
MQSNNVVLLHSIVAIVVQQICARAVPFLLHTLAKKSLDPAAASVRQPFILLRVDVLLQHTFSA